MPSKPSPGKGLVGRFNDHEIISGWSEDIPGDIQLKATKQTLRWGIRKGVEIDEIENVLNTLGLSLNNLSTLVNDHENDNDT